MGIIESCISELVFAKAENWNFNEITLSGEKIFVLSEINGKNSLKDICEKLNIKLSDIKNIINELDRLNLISLERHSKTVDKTTLEKDEKQVQPPTEKVIEVKKPPETTTENENKKTLVYRGVTYDVA